MPATKEAKWLSQFSSKVRRKIREAAGVPELRTVAWYSPEAMESDGVGVIVGFIDTPGPSLDVWAILDRFSGHSDPVPWIGVMASGEARARNIFRHLKRHSFDPLLVEDRQMVYERGASRHAHPLPRKYFGRPVVELYGGQPDKGIGIYLPPPRSLEEPPLAQSVARATRFLREVASLVGKPSSRDNVSKKAKPRVVLKRAVVSVRIVARNSTQAWSAKHRDNYTCRLCGLRPEDIYGSEGRSCLEAHHLDAVAGSDRSISRLDRIVSLCANCHRVIHRLPPEQRKFDTLRRRFRRAR